LDSSLNTSAVKVVSQDQLANEQTNGALTLLRSFETSGQMDRVSDALAAVGQAVLARLPAGSRSACASRASPWEFPWARIWNMRTKSPCRKPWKDATIYNRPASRPSQEVFVMRLIISRKAAEKRQ
jgi:hypothetical protein